MPPADKNASEIPFAQSEVAHAAPAEPKAVRNFLFSFDAKSKPDEENLSGFSLKPNEENLSSFSSSALFGRQVPKDPVDQRPAAPPPPTPPTPSK